MRTIPAICLLFAVSAICHAELDVTPQFVPVGDGLIRRAYFKDGDKQFAFTLDGESELSGDQRGAIVRFTNMSQASMTLRRSPFDKPLPFGEDTLPEYLKAATKMLPAQAEEVKASEAAQGVFPINHWKSCRYVFNYTVGGAAYTDAITFLVLDTGQQVVLHTTSRQKDFEAALSRSDDIMRRWHEVVPGEEKGEN